MTSFSLAVFPFLKTSRPVMLGGFTFRSTGDVEGLSEEQQTHVRKVSELLFYRDDWQIESATYAIIPVLEQQERPKLLDLLEDIQAAVSFLYTAPRHEFGDIFLSGEHSTVLTFTPKEISVVSQREVHGAVKIGARVDEADDLPLTERLMLKQPGFEGLYNFRHAFQVVAGSRLYGPMPRMVLNISQDLAIDVGEALDSDSSQAAAYRLLLKQLNKSAGERSNFLTAVRWYRVANLESNNEESAILNLSVAFEALLGLPHDDKTERLVDSISLLLGRVPRLSSWARQFYNARSKVVHEGRLMNSAFVAVDELKKANVDPLPLYQSLVSYGRQIFEMCLGTLLFGADLAASTGLEQKFISNEERLRAIVRTLTDQNKEPERKLSEVEPLINLVKDYQYVRDSALKIETMMGCVRAAGEVMLKQNSWPPELEVKLREMLAAERSPDHFDQLSALKELEAAFEESKLDLGAFHPIRTLVRYVWRQLFQHFFWLKASRESEAL